MMIVCFINPVFPQCVDEDLAVLTLTLVEWQRQLFQLERNGIVMSGIFTALCHELALIKTVMGPVMLDQVCVRKMSSPSALHSVLRFTHWQCGE